MSLNLHWTSRGRRRGLDYDEGYPRRRHDDQGPYVRRDGKGIPCLDQRETPGTK